MKLLLLFCAAVLAAQNPRNSPEDVAAGAKTFRSHCAACHGYNGEGGRGPNLAAGVFFHGSSDTALLNNISDGIAGTEMPGLFYSPDRVWQVIAYIRSLNQGAGGRPPGDPAKGQALFRSKGCGNCHRVNGEGGRLGPDLSLIGSSRSLPHLRDAIVSPNADVRQRYWVVSATSKQGQNITGFLMNEDTYTLQIIDMKEQMRSLSKADLSQFKIDKSSKMPSFQGKVSDKELEDLVAYLWSLRPTEGAR